MKGIPHGVVSANIIGKGNPFDTIEDLKEIHQQK